MSRAPRCRCRCSPSRPVVREGTLAARSLSCRGIFVIPSVVRSSGSRFLCHSSTSSEAVHAAGVLPHGEPTNSIQASGVSMTSPPMEAQAAGHGGRQRAHHGGQLATEGANTTTAAGGESLLRAASQEWARAGTVLPAVWPRCPHACTPAGGMRRFVLAPRRFPEEYGRPIPCSQSHPESARILGRRWHLQPRRCVLTRPPEPSPRCASPSVAGSASPACGSSSAAMRSWCPLPAPSPP